MWLKRCAKRGYLFSAGRSWTSIHVLPIDRDPRLEDRTTAAPTQPVDERDASPDGFHEVGGHEPERHVDTGRRAATVGTAGVRSGRSSLTRKPALFCRTSPPRYDPNGFPTSFDTEVLSGTPNALHRVRSNLPLLGKCAGVGIG